MSFLRRLFSKGEGKGKHKEPSDPDGVRFYVQCDECGEKIAIRIDKRFDLTRDSDSRTKAFLERLYALRHRHGFMMGKPGGAIITCAIPEGNEMLPPAFEMGKNAIMFYMMEEGMEFAGAVRVEGNVPCIKCGYDTECKIPGIPMVYGEDATRESIGVQSFEEQPKAIAEAKALGEKIGQMLRDKQ